MSSFEERPLDLFTRKVLIVTAVVLGVGLLWLVRHVLLLVFMAAVLAAGIAPAVRWVRVRWRYWFHKHIPRGTAVLIVYLPFVVVVIGLALILIPQLMTDFRELAAQMPVLIEQNILKPLEKHLPMTAVREFLRDSELPEGRMFGFVRGAAAAVGGVIAILFMVAWMLIDSQRLRNLILLIYPPGVRAERRQTLIRIGRRMSAWLSGQLLLALIIGVTTFCALVLLRIPYALPLAILAAVGELIPVIGPILGAVPACAIALLHSPWQFWSMLAFAILLQKFENLFIAPRVISKKVAVSPLAVFVAFMMGASLLGIVGAILAIPVAAIVQVAFEEAFVAHRERRQNLERAGTLLRQVD